LKRADILAEGGAYFIHHIVEDYLAYGPQLAAYDGVMLLFMVRGGEDSITYRTYNEADWCDPEDVGLAGQTGAWPFVQHHCGALLPGYSTIELETDIANNMSAVVIEDGGEADGVYLFYLDSNHNLCLLHGSGDHASIAWEGPVCRDVGFFEPPEAILYDGSILVFGVGAHVWNNTGNVLVVIVDPEQWDNQNFWDTPPLAVCYDEMNCGSFESRTTPSVAVDPGEDTVTGTDDDALVGVVTNVGHEMRLVEGPFWRGGFLTFDWLGDWPEPDHPDKELWLARPGGTDGVYRRTALRPALVIERPDPGLEARWTLWFQGNKMAPDQPAPYYRMLSTVEPSRGTVFSMSREGPEKKVLASEAGNVSLAFYRGKLRAAAAYDIAWEYYIHPGEPGDYHEPGYVFMPVADGVFRAAMKDSDDVNYIGQYMGDFLNTLFEEMNDFEYQQVMEANHMPTARPDTSGRKAAETTHIPHEDPPWLYWNEGVRRVRDMPTR